MMKVIKLSTYFYDYFAKEYRSEASVILLPSEITKGITQRSVQSCRKVLKNVFLQYRDGRKLPVAERLVKEYREYVAGRSDDKAKSRYNAFVYYYMSGAYIGSKAIAGKLNVSKETVFNYLNGCFDELLVLCMGVCGIKVQGMTGEDIVRMIICNFRLLSHMTDQYTMELFRCGTDRAAVEESRKRTQRVIQALMAAVERYDKYCYDEDTRIDTDIRKADILHECLAGASPSAIAEKYGVSPETVYGDMRENERRLSALLFDVEALI